MALPPDMGLQGDVTVDVVTVDVVVVVANAVAILNGWLSQHDMALPPASVIWHWLQPS
jgi:hypothetical protein